MKLVKPPPSAPMGAAEECCNHDEERSNLHDTHFLSRSALLMTKGYFHPLTSHGRKLDSMIQLIVRNVKRIFMRGYILQIAVLIAASGAFGDQIK